MRINRIDISEQIKRVKESIKEYRDIDDEKTTSITAYALEICVNLIESLMAKLDMENIERSSNDCNGGWIYCGDGENLPAESGYYDVTIEAKINEYVVRTTECIYFYKDIKLWKKFIELELDIDEIVIAWRNRPEPYQGPK